MGLIPEHIIGEIRDRADIVAVIGQHVKLRKTGHSHKGLCPFHSEKSASFNVNGDKGFFYCFGCQKKGDVFSFVMELEGKSFVEAAESLALRFGVTIPASEASQPGARSRRGEMLQIAGLAREFYIAQLDDRRGEPARDYLAERGIGPDIAAGFGLGYAPDEWGALADYLGSRRVPLVLAEQVGVVAPRKSGRGHYDRFRSRLMCPVADSSGDCVGFSGRLLGGAEAAKYINSPESPIFKKSRLLFGLDLAREGMRQRGRAILVEGNFDVISLHQAGFTETVAPLGTALTDDQAARLRRIVEVVVLLFDGDEAGRKATLRSLQTLLAAGLEVRIATLPTGVDPDDLVRKRGSEALQTLLSRAEPGVEYFIDKRWSQPNQSAHYRAQMLEEAAHVLKSVPLAAHRDLLIDQLATMLRTDQQTVRTNLRRALRRPGGSDNPVRSREESPSRPAGPPPERELDIIAILADHPALLPRAEELAVHSLLTDPQLRDMYSAARDGRPMLTAESSISPEIAKRVLEGMYTSVDNPSRCLDEVVASLRQTQKSVRLAELQREAEMANRSGDGERARALVKEILQTRKQVD
jgi:DNA primase